MNASAATNSRYDAELIANAAGIPPHANAASAPLSRVDATCVTITTRRRSNRSAAAPAQGASTRTGTKLQKLRTPSRNAECVSRYTSSAEARFWNHVPLAEVAL